MACPPPHSHVELFSYADITHFVTSLDDDASGWKYIVDDVEDILSRACVQKAMQVLPNVTYLHEFGKCPVPPARFTPPDDFEGTLLSGAVPHVMVTEWLRYEHLGHADAVQVLQTVWLQQ